MSRDYVTALAARTLGVGEFVRPRLASRFEGGRPAITERTDEIEAAVEAPHADAGRRPRVGNAIDAPAAERPVDGAATRPPGQAIVRRRARASGMPGVGERPRPTTDRDPPTHAVVERSPVDFVPPVGGGTIATVVARPTPAGPVAAHDRATAARTDEPPRASRRDVPDRRAADDAMAVERIESASAVSREIALRDSIALGAPASPAGRRASRPVAADVAEADDAEPTIHVTIGRLEVRAPQPPPVPRRVRRAPPAPMTLAEFLRQRSGSPGR